jgi:hypothetical protein
MRFPTSLLLFVLGLSSFAYAADPAPSASGLSRRLESSKKKGPSAMAVASAAHSAEPAVNPVPKIRWRTAVGDIATAVQRGELKREEIPKRYAELRKTRATRRLARIDGLQQEIGKDVFERHEVQEELAKHHRRIALLERARLVAESELEGLRRAGALMRIEGMRTREDDRFADWLQGLKDARAAALNAPSAQPSAASGPPSSSSVPAKPGAQ